MDVQINRSIWSSSKPKKSTVSKKDENEENIMNHFTDILSGTESNKTKHNVLYQVSKDLKQSNIDYPLKYAKFCKAVSTFDKLSHCLDLSYPPKYILNPMDQSTNIKLIKNQLHSSCSFRHAKEGN